MANEPYQGRRPRQITGASAIEFALVFPMLFAIIYGTVTYGYVYYLQQRINFIAQEAVSGDVVVLLGAGDITAWAYALPEQLEALAP